MLNFYHQKLFAWFSIASLVLQIGSGLIFAQPSFAEEIYPELVEGPTPEITPEVTPTVEPAPILESTPSPEPTPTLTGLDLVTPTPTPEEISPTPVVETNNQSSENSAPPSETGPPTGEASPPTDITPTPTVTPEQPTEQGQLAAVILENVAADSLELDLGPTASETSASLVTDKADYAPTDTVVIVGNGFNANETYTLIISSTDEPPVNFETQITTDENGSFIYAYQLDGTPRLNYRIEARDASDVVVATTTFTDPPNPSADLDQYANKDGTWVNGNLGESKATYYEGDSVPYRMRFDNLSLASHTVTFEWDTTKSGKHAIDYLTSFDRTASTADPCAGVSGCGSFTTFAIPKDPQVDNGSGSPITQLAGNFTLFGGTITAVSAYSYANGTGFTDDKSARITLTFTASVANPVLAWGGHIADRADWGPDNSAVNIPGSPYHMRLIDLDGSGGNQDRSLSTEAVIYPGSIRIIKDADPDNPQDFSYTTSGGLLPAAFSLDDDAADPTLSDTQLYSGILVTANNGNDYTITETSISGWALSFNTPVCTVTSPNGGSQSASASTISINLREGENVTCTFTNTRNQVTPTVTTAIHNSNHNVITSADAGSTVHDSASISGSLGTATGNVTFNWYNNGACTGTPVSTSGTFTLSSGAVDATTFAQGPLNTGSYSFKAHYAGDSNYFSANSDCEPLTINKVTPSISTTPSDGGTVGIQIHDTANVTGGLNPSGTVTFNLYGVNDATCAISAIFTDTQSLSGGSAISGNYTTAATGTYHWKATYNGDSNNNPVTSPCADEPVTTNKATPVLATDIHNSSHTIVTSVPAGSTVHDRTSISGGLAPTGTVDFTFYTSGDCTTGGAAAGTGIALVGGVAHPSSSEGPLNAGFYSFQAHYNGDTNNNAVDSACEPLTVTQLTPNVTTQIHFNGENIVTDVLALGTTVHDQATVTGTFGTPTGTVDFTFFNNGTCDPTGVAAGTGIALVGGVAHPSSSEGPLTTGSYSFRARYNGDNNYVAADSGCEPLSVEKAQLSISTDIHNTSEQVVTSVPLGSIVHDQATVNGIVGSIAPANQVTFKFFNNGTCAGDGIAAGSVALSGNIAHPSSSEGPLNAGSYSFQATIADDDNYTGVVSACESLTVTKANTTVTTHVHDAQHNNITNSAVALGSVVHDNASVGGKIGDIDITGNVTYHFYNNETCRGTPTDETVGIGFESSVTSTLAAGAYSYKADYLGDNNYATSTGVCEPFTVDRAQLNISTVVHSDSPDQVLSSNLALGDGAHDSASVTGKVNSFTLPSVTFYFFDKGVSCTNSDTTGGTALNTVAPDGSGVAHPSTSETSLAAGTYNFMAVVAGDNNYLGKTSDCEPFTVDKAQLSLESRVHDSAHVDQTNGSVPLGSVMHDTAKLSGVVGGFTPPTITFKSYTNGNCSLGEASVTNTGADEGDATRDRSAVSAALGASSYSYEAFVADDDNYIGTNSGCEPFTVNKAQLTVDTTIHNANHDSVTTSVPLGSVLHDTAAVTGGVQGFTVPTPTFTLTSNYTDVCDQGSAVGNNGTEANGDAKSAASSALAAGTYAYRASVAGNENYLGDTSDCEPFTVDKAQLTVTTHVHDSNDNVITSADLGSIVHDQAAVSGTVGGFTQSAISFLFYNNDSCTGDGSGVANVGTDPAGGVRSADSSGLAFGSYSYNASVSGDSNYLGDSSDCEPFSIGQGISTVSTTLHKADESVVTVGSSVPLNTVMHDLATVNVSGSFAPTGNVDFTFFDNADCSGDGTAMGTIALNGANPGVAHPSDSTSPLAVGDYSFKASWVGDNNYVGNTSSCENFTVSRADTTTVTHVYDAQNNDITNNSVPLGSVVHDSTTVGTQVGSFAIGGTVTYHFYLTADCTGDSTDETVNVGNDSSATSVLAAGAYSYNADYNGDANYNPSTGVCEPFAVNKGTPTITTEVHDSLHNVITLETLDTSVHDLATVLGIQAFMPTGNVDFTFFPNGTCAVETESVAGTVALDGSGVAHPSDSETITAGHYSFRAHFAGDSNYNEVTSDCEPFTNLAIPSITIAKTNDHSGGGTAGDTVNYTLTLTNGPVPLLVDVVDVMPLGFTYVAGSGVPSPYNISGNVLTWNDIDLPADGTAKITYQAKIDGSQPAGTYYNLATCHGVTRERTADCGIVNSSVPIGQVVSTSTTIGGTVLGVATVLGAATGSPTWLLILALMLIFAGFSLRFWDNKRKVWLFTNLKMIGKRLAIFAAIAMLFFAMAKSAQAVTEVRIANLPEYERTDNFKVYYTALNTDDPNSVNVIAYVKKEGGFDWKTFGGTKTEPSSYFEAFGYTLDGDGTYHFKIEANGITSGEISTTVDRSGPDRPKDYRKDREGSTAYRIYWKDPSNDDYAMTRIFASQTQNFIADDSTKKADVGGGKDQELNYLVTGLEPDKEYFFALQGFDKAGNGSGLVGDGGSVTYETTSAPTQVVLGAVGEVKQLPEEEKAEGEILGGATEEITPTPAGIVGEVGKAVSEITAGTSRGRVILAVIIVVLAVVAYFFWRLRSSK